MQKSDDMREENRRVLHRLQKSLQFQNSNIRVMFVACKFQKKTERSESSEIYAKSIAN